MQLWNVLYIVLAILLCTLQANAVENGGSIKSSITMTFIDLLSSDIRFGEFLHTVQRLGMVIPINRLRNTTLFVPTNEALRKHRRDKENSDTGIIYGKSYLGVSDWQAWYHFIRDKAIDIEEMEARSMVWESLSTAVDNNKSNMTGIFLKTTTSSNGKVHLNSIPIFKEQFNCSAGTVYLIDGVLQLPPTIKQLLSGLPTQKYRATGDGPISLEGINTSNGSSNSSSRTVNNGYNYLERLATVAGWSNVLGSNGESNDGEAMHTVWAFNDASFRKAFNYAERLYLTNGIEFAEGTDKDLVMNDARLIASNYISIGSISLYRLGEGTHKVAGILKGKPHTVIVKLDKNSPNGLSGNINGLNVSAPDLIARNGIVQGIDVVKRPDEFESTPQKMLIGLNATLFIQILKDAGLSDYIDGTLPECKTTLLAPNNRALEEALGMDSRFEATLIDRYKEITLWDNMPGFADALNVINMLSSDSYNKRDRDWARYHILDGQYNIEDLEEEMLLRTKLASSATNGHPQVVKVSADSSNGAVLRHVEFNGASNILPDPVVVGNTTIYLLSSSMDTPPSLINALIQDLNLALFVAAMGASHIAEDIQQRQGVTILVPVADAFTSLGLVWSYLSLPGDSDAQNDLARVVRAHVLTQPVYSDEFPMHSSEEANMKIVKSLDGDAVGLYCVPHKCLAKPIPADNSPILSKRFTDNNEMEISESDLLLHTGVAHVLRSDLIMPSSVDITTPKLIRGMHSHIFVNLLERLNLTFVLEDPRNDQRTISPHEYQIMDNLNNTHPVNSTVVGYSLLVPSDKVWRENPAYRELIRRDSDDTEYSKAMNGGNNGDNNERDNPWRNATTVDIIRYIDMLVRLHVIPIIEPSSAHKGQLASKNLALSDRKTYPTLLEGVGLMAREYATGKFIVQLDNIPFYQNPGNGMPFVSLATVVRSGFAVSGAVFEVDSLLRLPPVSDESGGWGQIAWNALVWITGLGMGGGLVGVSGYWARQWWMRSDYQPL